MDKLFNSAWQNFSCTQKSISPSAPACFVMLLTERNSENWFHETVEKINSSSTEKTLVSNGWSATTTTEPETLLVKNNAAADKKIFIVAGQQIVTKEKIEVLSLCSLDRLEDGMPLAETIKLIEKGGALIVLPWGVGKWFGKRGKIIDRIIAEDRNNTFFLGDNGGRPPLWPYPGLLRKAEKAGRKVLRGSDPLPLSNETQRVGKFGCYFEDSTSSSRGPSARVKDHLLSRSSNISLYGNLQKNFKFIINQIRLRLR